MSNFLRLDFNERSDFPGDQLPGDVSSEQLWQYPDRQPLESLIAEQNSLTASQVICTNGGDEAIMILMRIIKETCRVILPLPAFSQYVWGVESWQLDVDLIAGNEDLSINIDAVLTAIEKANSVESKIVQDEASALNATSINIPVSNKLSDTYSSVTIITRPNNPSGEFIALDDLLRILNAAKTNKAWVFLDEAYIEFSGEASVANTLLDEFDNLVILRTLSKAYGLAGIRLGYLLGSSELIAAFNQRCAPFNIGTPTLNIAKAALDADNQKEVDEYCQRIIDNRNILSDSLKQWGINVLPSQANFLVLQLPTFQAKAVSSFLKRNGILVRSFIDNLMKKCLRITIPYQLESLLPYLQQALAADLICLDMDGVLIDTSGSYDATVMATVELLSSEYIESADNSDSVKLSELEALRAKGGYNNDWVLSQKLLSQRGIEIDLQTVTDVFQKFYLGDENTSGLVENETPLINSSLINKISNSKNKTFAIVTGRPMKEAQAGAKFIGFDALNIISLDCVKEAKPSPEGIKKLQNNTSKLSWMCGDNPDDMQAALASGSLAIGIAGGIAKTDKQEALYQAGADIVLESINQLEAWL